MRARWMLPAVGVLMRLAGTTRRELLARPQEVRRALTVDDVLPAPVRAVATGAEFVIPPGVSIVTSPDPAAARVGAYLADLLGGRVAEAGAIELRLEPGHGDEGYALEVEPGGVTIRASGGAGLFWGVQTLRQLLPAAGPAVVPGVRISDRPRFAYRGVMLDVARHFFDVATVTRLIDLAAMYKVNHLHLHLTDDQGWRIAIDRRPRLATLGGATQVGGGAGGYYTAEDYRAIVAHAQARFMTVVPEIDVPGHTNAALAAYPELAYDGVTPRPYTGTRVGLSALHPGRADAFLEDVLGEIAALTPGPYLHIGGDEALRMSDADYAAVVGRAQEIVASHGRTVIGWHELSAAARPGTVLQFWGNTPWARDLVAAARRGHRIIMSPADRTYLDQRHAWRGGPGRTWAGPIGAHRSYDWDPAGYLPGVDEAAVLGVEAPLWTETVATVEDIDRLVFPRLAAVAEIGWSPATTHDWYAFRHRLGAQAPRWEALGVTFTRVPGVPWVVSAPSIPGQRSESLGADTGADRPGREARQGGKTRD